MVPGEVAGLWAAWQRFGRVPWSDLFQPTIRLAREGFKVGAHLADAIEDNEETIRSEPTLRYC